MELTEKSLIFLAFAIGLLLIFIAVLYCAYDERRIQRESKERYRWLN